MKEKSYIAVVRQVVEYRVPVLAFDESDAEAEALEIMATTALTDAENDYFSDLIEERIVNIEPGYNPLEE